VSQWLFEYGAVVHVEYPSTVTGAGASAIYKFLISKGFNKAAACGILANIDRESSYTPDLYNSQGSGAYGICQWLGTRRTALFNFCKERGLASDTLDGQLQFFEYEMQTSYYNKWYKQIIAVPNTADGAYEAGYLFCKGYEVPSTNKNELEQISISRGNFARTDIWPQY